jgi:hypothetical protein
VENGTAGLGPDREFGPPPRPSEPLELPPGVCGEISRIARRRRCPIGERGGVRADENGASAQVADVAASLVPMRPL